MSDAISPADRAKRAAAACALDHLSDGMVVGLGTGSTAKWFVDLIAEHGIKITGVPTSSQTRRQAESLGIPVTTLDAAGALDLTVDGADEFDPALNLIKGGGGALLQEKIVASASKRMVVIADPSKEVATLGRFDLPVEIVRFGWTATARAVRACLAAQGIPGRDAVLRESAGKPFVTDEGHFILDLAARRIDDPVALDRALNAIPGVVENGLFCGIATEVIVGAEDGSVRVLEGP